MGVLTLFVVSFSYHGEVAKVGKMSDSLMQQISSNKSLYERKKIEAIVTENTIVPGINGRKVDVNKSYNAMKQDGIFDVQKLVYKKNKIKDELSNNKNKHIISGNQTKKQVALIFKVKNNDDTNKVTNILLDNDVKATFFVDEQFAKNKFEKLKYIVSNKNVVGNLGDSDNYIWLKTLITSSGFQKNNYCIEDNSKRIYFCQKYNDYTIKVKEEIKETPLINVKNNLKNGAFLYFDINNKLIKELPNIINYVKSKGYSPVTLEEILQE